MHIVWYSILPLVRGEGWSSANHFRNFEKKVLCVWFKMQILRFYFVEQKSAKQASNLISDWLDVFAIVNILEWLTFLGFATCKFTLASLITTKESEWSSCLSACLVLFISKLTSIVLGTHSIFNRYTSDQKKKKITFLESFYITILSTVPDITYLEGLFILWSYVMLFSWHKSSQYNYTRKTILFSNFFGQVSCCVGQVMHNILSQTDTPMDSFNVHIHFFTNWVIILPHL